MLYMHMNDPVTKFGSKPEENEYNKAVMNEIKVDGLVLSQEEIAKNLEYTYGEKDALHFVPNSKNSQVDSCQMEKLLNQAIETAKNTAEKISEGEIEVNPLVIKKFDACQYCKFANCCGINNK